MRDKSRFSYLIAFARQLAEALDDDSDDDIAVAVSSLGLSLGVLLADLGIVGSEESGDDADGVEDFDDDGDDTPLGGHVVRGAAEAPAPSVDVTRRRVGGGSALASGGVVVGSKRRRASLLTKPKKGARRGKK